MADLETLKVAMKGGKVADVRTLVGALLEENVAAQEILNDGLLAAMGEVGQRFKRNEVFVPEVLVAARDEGRHGTAETASRPGWR